MLKRGDGMGTKQIRTVQVRAIEFGTWRVITYSYTVGDSKKRPRTRGC
jgi:hypothetical protein